VWAVLFLDCQPAKGTVQVETQIAKKVEFDDDSLSVELHDGQKIAIPLVYFPKLLQASREQRLAYIISGGGIGLHWEELDEDIRIDNLLLGYSVGYDRSISLTG
jgi:hypothetical protein